MRRKGIKSLKTQKTESTESVSQSEEWRLNNTSCPRESTEIAYKCQRRNVSVVLKAILSMELEARITALRLMMHLK